MRRPLAIALLVALALPAAAVAHSLPTSEFPGIGQRINSQPHHLAMTFDEAILRQGDTFNVFNSKGKNFAATPVVLKTGMKVTVPIGTLPPGGYTVRWRVVSTDDGHVTNGAYTFGFRAAPPPLTAAYGAAGAAFWDDFIRYGLYVALMVAIGGIAFRLVVIGPSATPTYEQRFNRSVGTALGAGLVLLLVGFLLRAEDILQLPFHDFLYASTSPIVESTAFGLAYQYMTVGLAAAAGFVVLAWVSDRTYFLWPALAIGIVSLVGLPRSSHSASLGHPVWLTETSDWVHLTAAAIWLGGLIQLALFVWPGAGEELKRRSFLRFSMLAEFAIATIVLAGGYLAYTRLRAFSDFWNAHYGRVLVLKLAIVGAVLLFGAFHHYVIRPRLVGGASPGSWTIGRSLALETALGLAIVGVTAVLVNTSPPPPPQTTLAPTSAEHRAPRPVPETAIAYRSAPGVPRR
jgi:copper transport protein